MTMTRPMRFYAALAVFAAVTAFSISGVAQSTAQTPASQPSAAPNFSLTPYSTPITLDAAKKVAAVALAEAAKNHWLMTVAVVDPHGDLIYYERTDNSQWGSAKVAIEKARSAAIYKRPTKAFQDAVAKGGVGLRVLGLDGAVVLEGGVPLISEGKIIGAIGVSGDLSENDAVCANAAAATVK
jgi:glc operon protein GlcG